jgi:hypothetical protein
VETGTGEVDLSSVSTVLDVDVPRDGSLGGLPGVTVRGLLLGGGVLGGGGEEVKGDGVLLRVFFDPDSLLDEEVTHDTNGQRTAAQTLAPYTIARNTPMTSSFSQAARNSSSVV